MKEGQEREPVTRDDLELPAAQLRWRCDESWLEFETTEEVEPVTGVVGQDDAVEALRFGLETEAPGQNVFVRGLSGTGRMSLVRHLMGEMRASCALVPDRLYAHNFEQPDRPRLLNLPAGNGRPFKERIDAFVDFIEEELVPGLASETVRSKRKALEEQLQEKLRRLGDPFQKELEANGLTLVPIQVGQTMQPVILPLVDGQPAPPDRFQKLRQEGKISEAEAKALQEKIESFGKRFQELGEKVNEAQTAHQSSGDGRSRTGLGLGDLIDFETSPYLAQVIAAQPLVTAQVGTQGPAQAAWIEQVGPDGQQLHADHVGGVQFDAHVGLVLEGQAAVSALHRRSLCFRDLGDGPTATALETPQRGIAFDITTKMLEMFHEVVRRKVATSGPEHLVKLSYGNPDYRHRGVSLSQSTSDRQVCLMSDKS